MPTDTPLFPLHIATHNVQELNSPAKHIQLFEDYQFQKLDVFLLHFPKHFNPSFIHLKYPQFCLANTEIKLEGLEYSFPNGILSLY